MTKSLKRVKKSATKKSYHKKSNKRHHKKTTHRKKKHHKKSAHKKKKTRHTKRKRKYHKMKGGAGLGTTACPIEAGNTQMAPSGVGLVPQELVNMGRSVGHGVGSA